MLVIAVAAVSAYTPFLEGKYYQRWFAWPGVLATAQIPLLVAFTTFLLFRSLAKRHERAPFLLTLTLFALSMLGLAISIWPDIIPGRVTIWQAAAPAASQEFMLVGTVVLVPLILAYTAWSYWVFRGKVDEEGYH